MLRLIPGLLGGSPFSLHGAIDDAYREDPWPCSLRKMNVIEGYFQVMEHIIIQAPWYSQ
jgi:hypothetical protein